MSAFILIFVCIIAGLLFRKYSALPTDAHKGINAWIIYVALPAVSLKYLPHIQWTKDYLFPIFSPIIIWLCGWFLIRIYASTRKLNRQAEGGLKLAAGLSNTSFLGFPLIIAYFGEAQLGIAIVCDQVTFMLLSTAGIIVAMNSSANHTLQPLKLLKKLLIFPPFLAFVVALTVPRFIDISPLAELFDKLASTVAPLALFSIGLQLRFSGWQKVKAHITVALLYKLILAPAIILIIALVLGLHGSIAEISVFEASMATLLSAGIIAEQYELEPSLVNLVIGIGIVISFLTTAGWWWIIDALLR